MIWIIAIGLAIFVGVVDVFVYACCVVAGREDELTVRCMSEIDVIQKPVAPSVVTCEPECRRV